MTNQEFEKNMNLIAERAARVELEMENHRAWHAENDRKHQVWKAEFEDLLTRLARVTKEGFNDTNAKINALVDAQIRMEEEQRKTDEQLRKTDEQLKTTDEKFQRFLDRLSNGSNNN